MAYVLIDYLSSKSHLIILHYSFLHLFGEKAVIPIRSHLHVQAPPNLQGFILTFVHCFVYPWYWIRLLTYWFCVVL